MTDQLPNEPAPAEQKPERKPRTPRKPVATDGGKVSLEGVKSLQALEKLGLPVTATGGSLTTWQQDLESVEFIEVSKDGAQWARIWNNPKLGDKAPAVATVPAIQLRSLLFIVQSYLVRPVTDRGYAYCKWVAENSTTLKGVFGTVQVRIHNNSAAIQVLPVTVPTALKKAEMVFPDLQAGLTLQPAQRRAVTGKKKVSTEAQADLVFGVNF